jgi:integrase
LFAGAVLAAEEQCADANAECRQIPFPTTPNFLSRGPAQRIEGHRRSGPSIFGAPDRIRRGECQQLRWDEVDALGTCLALGDTKTGASLRPLSRAAFAVIDGLEPISDYVFAAGPEQKGYQGLPGLWETVQKTARLSAETAAKRRGESIPEAGPLDAVTLHSLRHSFAGIAEQLGATIPTIAAMLGHRVSGVTGGYILKRVDSLLIEAANRVGDHIAALMRREAPSAQVIQFRSRGRNARSPAETSLRSGVSR